ncbi:MAG TPA: PQQ-dependent sugar dehydrogenase [Candidatus Binatia bacterium]|nr:PQQ-dependent sugar dehydrogenase [Candidatus Binatia bacterium]
MVRAVKIHAGLIALLVATRAAAATPVAGDALVIRDVAHPRGAKIIVDALLPAAPALDPRSAGATFEVVGDADADGATGIVALRAVHWRAVASPSGSGYEYDDPGASNGIRRATLLPDVGGLRLRVVGAGPAIPFRIRHPHAAVDVRFAVGSTAYCARFASFAQNGPLKIAARNAPAPAACAARRARCGNLLVEAGEECDDGDVVDGDGCASDCSLESPDAACAGVPESPHDRVHLVRIASGLSNVTHVTAPPLDPSRLFVVRQAGEIRVIRDGVLLSTPFLSLAPDVDISAGGERGLLSLAFHPDYERNGRFFVYFTAPSGELVIARYQVSADPDVADAASRIVLLRVSHPAGNHNGGQLAFGPDGYLYAGLGDGGGAGDPDENGQNPASVLGKVLRIDVDVEHDPFRRPPPDNPNPIPGRQGLVWALGFRNPWRFGFDRLTGDLWIADVGQGSREEIDFQPASSTGGENYGWDVYEGTMCFDPEPLFQSCPPPETYVEPIFEYEHTASPPDPSGCSVTGGFVYRGCRLPAERGRYFFSDFCTRFFRTLRVSGGALAEPLDRTAEIAPTGATVGNVTTFGEDARGEIYVGDQTGQVFALVPNG